jgi:NitT/TauT family transport system substrate-binding protein
MLVTKQVDAVTGFDSTTLLVLKANGMAIEDANVLSYADFGFDVYGNAFLVNPAFLAANPDAVRAFVRAAARGWRDAMADPKAGIGSLMKNNTLAKADIEEGRFLWLATHQILTPTTRKEGIGAYDPARMAKNLDQVAKAFGLPRTPAVSEIYDDRFLPPQAERMPLN